MKDKYITITGIRHYYGLMPFKVGNLIRCIKEPKNIHDSEAIKATMPMIGTVGYVANSAETVAGGTVSAGRLYDSVDKSFYAKVLFTTFSHVICKVEQKSIEEIEKLLIEQMTKDEDDLDLKDEI